MNAILNIGIWLLAASVSLIVASILVSFVEWFVKWRIQQHKKTEGLARKVLEIQATVIFSTLIIGSLSLLIGLCIELKAQGVW